AVAVVGDEAARDPNAATGAAALYPAMASRTRNTRQAAAETREIYDLAVGTSPKARQFLADESVRLGVVHSNVSEGDFEAAVAAGQTPEAREIRSGRERYVTERGTRRARESAYE